MASVWQRFWSSPLFVSIRWFLGGILRRFKLWLPPLLLDGADALGVYARVKPWFPAFLIGPVDWLIGHALIGFGLLVAWAAALTYHELRLQVPDRRIAELREILQRAAGQGNGILAAVTGSATQLGMGANVAVKEAAETWGLEVYPEVMKHNPADAAEFFPVLFRPGVQTPRPGNQYVDGWVVPPAAEIEAFLRRRLAVIQRILRDLEDRR